MYVKRCSEFAVAPDATLQQDVKDHLKRAQTTAIEFSMFEGLLLSLKNQEAGKSALNDSIASMKEAGLVQKDIHGGLWGICGKVLKGQKLA